MNLLSFMKKKEEKGKADKKTTKVERFDTEINPIVSKKPKAPNRNPQEQGDKGEKTQKIERCVTATNNQSVATVYKNSKTTLQIKQLLHTLWNLKNQLESQYDCLLSGTISNQIYKEVIELLATSYFRFRKTTFVSALDEYSNVIQALQLLISKLSNNEKLTEKIMIRNEQDFVLFFKFFFSKPYTLINLPSVRKVIKLLWDQFIFSSLTPKAMLDNLKLWIFGISAPLNPTMNKLHQLCTEKSEQISKFVNHRTNQCVYIGVNESDALCLTPLMIAIICKNTKGVQKLIKNGADPSCCPMVVNLRRVNESIEESKFGNKIMLRKFFGLKERMQPDVMQILRNEKRIDQIAQILCWQSFYDMKKFRKDTQLSDFLEMFPNGSFQIDWKEYRGMLCFKQLPQDIITVYKRNHCLRIDFHISDLEKIQIGQQIKHGHYSMILTAEPKKDNTLFFINHGQKSIRDLIEDLDIQSVKEKYNNIIKFGNIYNSQVSEIKAIFFPDQNRFSATIESYYQNLTKFQTPSFSTLKEYLRDVINSETINYSVLQKQELQAILSQTAISPPKVKSKTINSTCSIDVEWSNQHLNLIHLGLVLKLGLLAFPSSLLLNKNLLILKQFEDPMMRNYQFRKKLPTRFKLSSEGQINIQAEIKNIHYCLLEQSVFKIEVRAKEMNYEQIEEPIDLSHLHDTVFMDEMYSISASRFMGKSEQMIEIQESEANKKFEQLLKIEGLWNCDDDDQK